MSSDDHLDIAAKLQGKTTTLKNMARAFKHNPATGCYNFAGIPVARPGCLIPGIGLAAHSPPLPAVHR